MNNKPSYIMSDINKNVLYSYGKTASKYPQPSGLRSSHNKSNYDNTSNGLDQRNYNQILTDLLLAKSSNNYEGSIRKSRFQSFSKESPAITNMPQSSRLVRRDFSVPPERNWDGIEDPYIMGDLGHNVGRSMNSSTPPPVNIISSTNSNELLNRKAIIRPLAFKPVSTTSSSSNSSHPHTKVRTPGSDISIHKKTSNSRGSNSPPPVPPHKPTHHGNKTKLGRVSSMKSTSATDSLSDYYSNNNSNKSIVISTKQPNIYGNSSNVNNDESPTLNEIPSLNLDTVATKPSSVTKASAGIEANGTEYSDYSDSLENEKKRNRMLETALANSNCKLIESESMVNELRQLFNQRCQEVAKTTESLTSTQMSLATETERARQLEFNLQTLLQHHQQTKNRPMTDQACQTVTFPSDASVLSLIEQFDEERNVWNEEKRRVLIYQKQLEAGCKQLMSRCATLEQRLTQKLTSISPNIAPLKTSSSSSSTANNYLD